MHLADLITQDLILPDMQSMGKRDAIFELAALVAGQECSALQETIARILMERERLASTAIGNEIAIPHGKLNSMQKLVLALGRSKQGLDFESVDGKPTRLFFVLLAPENSTGIHLKALARISRLCKEPSFCSRLLEAADSREMYDVLCTEDAKFHVR